MKITVTLPTLEKWKTCDADCFLDELVDSIRQSVGGKLTAESMAVLSAEQLTIWGYHILREELMDGGFVQLIYNGYGPFFFQNPFAKVMKLWGIPELAKLINKAKKLYAIHREALTQERSDNEFMALFEQYPAFDDLDDSFVEEEEDFTQAIANYARQHLNLFIGHEDSEE